MPKQKQIPPGDLEKIIEDANPGVDQETNLGDVSGGNNGSPNKGGGLADVQKVFGPDFKPADAFTPELQAQNIFGAVRVTDAADPNQVFTVGSGGSALTAAQFKTMFGTDDQKGIVGQITKDQAAQLGITGPGKGFSLDEVLPQEGAKRINPDTGESETFKDGEYVGDIESAVSSGDFRKIQETISPDQAAPEAPDLVGTQEAQRSLQGLPELESSLVTQDDKIRTLKLAFEQGRNDLKESGTSLQLMEGREKQLFDQFQFQLRGLNLERQVIADLITTKSAAVAQVMLLTQQDFANSSKVYQDAYANKVAALELMMGIKADQRDQEQQAQIEAKANLQTLLDLIPQGTTFSDLDSSTISQISSFENKAGLPSGFSETALGLKNKAGDEIQSVTSRTDGNKSYLDILYVGKDGPYIKSIFKGDSRKAGGAGSGKSTTGLPTTPLGRSQLGIPISWSTSQADQLITNSEAPDWYAKDLQNRAKQSLRMQDVQDEWATLRSDVINKATEDTGSMDTFIEDVNDLVIQVDDFSVTYEAAARALRNKYELEDDIINFYLGDPPAVVPEP